MKEKYPISGVLPLFIGTKKPCKFDFEIVWSTDENFWKQPDSEVKPDEREDDEREDRQRD